MRTLTGAMAAERKSLLDACGISDYKELAEFANIHKSTAKAFTLGKCIRYETELKIRRALGGDVAKERYSHTVFPIDRTVLDDVLEMCGFKKPRDVVDRTRATTYVSKLIFKATSVTPKMLKEFCRITGSTPDELISSFELVRCEHGT